jgi:hypothetical protein
MGLKYVRRALKTELRAETSMRLFDETKKRYAALAEHETPLSVLAVLGDESTRRWAEREAVTRALVTEEQERPHPLWAALLLAAYYPMLSRLRHRIYGNDLDPEDFDQLVVSTFLEVVRAFPLADKRDRTAMHLRQITQRRVFRHIREEHASRVLIAPDDVSDMPPFSPDAWPGSPKPRRRRHKVRPEPMDCRDAIELLTTRAAHLGQDQIDLVVTTMVRGERLRVYVERTFPDREPDERDRIYQRLKRQRSRTLARLRDLLADLRCPRSAAGGLCPSRTEKEEASDGQ